MLTALLMLVLLVPTMTWVHLRVPRAKRLIEALCLLPLVIPAIVLVVGIASLYSWVTYFLGDSPLTLTFVYVVLVLPYSYRAVEAGLTAVDLRTLSEAARSLGASWPTVMLRVVLPNVRAAVLLGRAPVRRARPGGVHHRLAAQLRDPAGRHRAARQAQRRRVDRGLAGGPGLRLRAAAGGLAGRRAAAHRAGRGSRAGGRAVDRRAAAVGRRGRAARPGQGLLRRPRARRADPGGAAGGAGLPARPVGLRQDDGAAGAGRPGDRRQRAGARRPARHHRSAGQQARHGHGVPGVQPVPAPHGPRQRRLRAAAARGHRR